MKKLLLILCSLILLTACNSEPMAFTPESGDTIASEPMAFTPESGDTIAIVKTSHGTMKVLLHTEEAPETTTNFIELSKAGKYNDTIFHRVIKDFMIQGGDFENRNGTGGYSYMGPGTVIKDEFHPDLKNIHGALSMANRGPQTGGSQFFIIHAEETSWLDGKHSVFGYVYKGKDVIDKIANLETEEVDPPVEEVVIESIEIDTY